MALNAAAAYVGQTETAAAIQGSLTASYWDQWKGYVPGVTVEPPWGCRPASRRATNARSAAGDGRATNAAIAGAGRTTEPGFSESG